MTRKEAIEIISSIDKAYRTFSKEEYKALEMAIQVLEQPRWIPVSEGLPAIDEECHSFLVTDSNGNVGISEFYLTFIDLKPYWSGMIDVIAWMPLPEPYKTKSEDVE